ncbi:erythrocyte membrane protein 1, PfEMP1, putative [Plasmodium sp. gorilla clade G2]|uniref:erythrocyte membrane protein 1, PfEMP1, putative n=1 Tax=Plasmodium sp. gorilla clade G2 TaxID=880535 RepID=UPI000D28D3F5|nr:erythrocyte membrane protein 1, PfEMP1, putative [Plasmodium sp. gorilla clade G2]SOV20415.1 erythrocyte membrane protein 1, PfEMP1, putative [Plasmodium sp. gorilla clade G2]
MPTKTSTNRYVPYGRYKGRTYIYMEGEETDDYVRDISSSDVTTSSSESEYEEIDIYKPRSPKYKTLIEVVLKPTKQPSDTPSGTIPSDIPNSRTIPSHIPINDEWNQLKHDFILNMLQNDIPGNTTDTNISYSGMPIEQPFITQIQDRKLYSDDSEIIYNIDWNIPENITTNTATYNSLYSGIDLINDSLNSGNNIYDELLKRKENELYGTKHRKHTTTNSVAKQIYDDPTLNQIELFDKWLERNKDMYNQWNIQRDMLNQWNIQRDNDNTTNHTHKLLNTNLSIEISSDINATSKMDMSDTNTYTYLDDMDSFENGSDENLL